MEAPSPASEPRAAKPGDADAARLAALVLQLKQVQAPGSPNVRGAIEAMEPILARIRAELASIVCTVLNSYEGETVRGVEEKRVVAKSLNKMLDGIGLRIKCPRTGRGAALIGQYSSNPGGVGRFQLRPGGVGLTTLTSVRFPHVELMLRDVQQKPRGFPAER